MTYSARSRPQSHRAPDRPERLWHAWRESHDATAFADLVRGQGRYAADLARRAGASQHEAEDAVQDALVRLAQEASDEPLDVGIRAWLCRRVVLGVKMRARAEGRRRRRQQVAASRAVPPAAADRSAQDAEVARVVEARLRALPPADRTLVILRNLYGMSHAEIAFILGIAEGACRTRAHRALARLREGAVSKGLPAVALLGVPALAQEAALLSAATGATATGAAAAATTTGATIAGWKLAVGGAVAACAVGVVVGLPGKAPPPPAPEPAVVLAMPVPDEPPAAIPPTPVQGPVTSAGLRFLAAHLDAKQDATTTLWNVAALRALFPAPKGAPYVIKAEVAETPLDLAQLVLEGRPLVLGPGVFRITRRLSRPGRHPIEISGAGMERTVLLPPKSGTLLRTTAVVPGFVLRDLTVEGDVAHLSGRSAMFFERVRFRAWTDRAGYGAPVGVRAPALVVFHTCSFVGGYRHRADGCAFGVRGSALALFERCHFADLDYALGLTTRGGVSGRSMVHLSECFFDGPYLCHPVQTDVTGVSRYPIRIRGGRAAARAELTSLSKRQKRFDSHARGEISGLRYEPATYRSTLAELRTVLRAVPRVEGEDIVGVESIAWLGVPEKIFGVHSYGPRRVHTARLWKLLPGGRCIPVRDDKARAPRWYSLHPGRSLDLGALLDAAWADLPADAHVAGIGIHSNTSGKSHLSLFDRYQDQIEPLRLASPQPR